LAAEERGTYLSATLAQSSTCSGSINEAKRISCLERDSPRGDWYNNHGEWRAL